MRALCMNKDEVHLDVYYMMPWGEIVLFYPLPCVVYQGSVCSRMCSRRSVHGSSLIAGSRFSSCIHPHLKHPLLLGVHVNGIT